MRLHIAGAALCALMILPAYAEDFCDIALTSGAFNTSDERESLKIMYEQKEDICRKEYNSSEEFRGAAKSGGFNLSYAGIGLGASGGSSTNKGKLSFASEDFCQASEEEFSKEYSSYQFVSSADAALRAWSGCVKDTKKNALWLSYDLNADATGFSGTMYRTAAEGRADLLINSMQVTPDSRAGEISCQIGNSKVNVDYFNDKSVKADTFSVNLQCTKPEDVSVKISFGTDQAALGWVVLPSKSAARETDLEGLSKQIIRLEGELHSESARLEGRIDANAINLESTAINIGSVKNAVSDIISRLDLLIVVKENVSTQWVEKCLSDRSGEDALITRGNLRACWRIAEEVCGAEFRGGFVVGGMTVANKKSIVGRVVCVR